MISYCFKFGNYEIPNSYIAENGYECAPHQRQDVEPFTDAKGVTHRNVVEHTKSDINITFRQLKWAEFTALIEGLTSNYINDGERDAICSYLDLENMQIDSGHFYLDPSAKFKVKRLNDKMDAFTLHFVEY